MQNKVVIITGASSGIGLACAKEFAARGARLSLCARSADKLNKIKEELTTKGYDVIVTPVDVSNENDCKMLVEETVKSFGRIDILINNAGISMRGLFKDTDINVLQKVMGVNFWGAVYCTKYALPYLLKSKGSVTGISSIAGFMGLPGRTGYSASKFAMHGFLETLRVENYKTGLHVLIVAPGFTESNVRKSALNCTGEAQGETPRDESKMMPASIVAKHIANGIKKRRRTIILTFKEGKFAVFLHKWFPKLADKLSYSLLAKEPDSPFN
ncbi:SDR family oxidoreductase [Marinilabiliaceae bacterium ANBcel2]|nr:SDR family oxidoreductase [Marinilabiliaceae bacterium ANBcel2]